MNLKQDLPQRRFLNRQEAAHWLGVSIDTFMALNIPACDLGPRCKRWDLVDIETYVLDTKSSDSARTSNIKRRRQSLTKRIVKNGWHLLLLSQK